MEFSNFPVAKEIHHVWGLMKAFSMALSKPTVLIYWSFSKPMATSDLLVMLATDIVDLLLISSRHMF